MLSFLSLTAKNALSYKTLEVPLESQGLVLLRGSNGGGKSAILTILDNLLFSSTTKGLNFGQLINIHVGKDFESSLKFSKDGVEYVIECNREHTTKPNGLHLYRGGEHISRTMRQNDIKALIPKILGIDRTSFLSKVYLSQEHSHILVSGTPFQKEEYLMKIFGLVTYEKLADICKKYAKASKEEAGAKTAYELRIKQLEEKIRPLPTKKKLHNLIETKIAARNEIKTHLDLLEKKKTTLITTKSLIKLRQKIFKEIQDLGIEEETVPSSLLLDKLAKSIEEFSDIKTHLKQNLDLAIECKQINEELASINPARSLEELKEVFEVLSTKKTLLQVKIPEANKARELKKKLNKLTQPLKTLEELEQDEALVENAVKKLEKELHDLDSRIKRGVCPTCKRSWGMTEEELIQTKARLEENRTKLDDLNKKRYLVKNSLKTAQEIETLTEKLEGLPSEDPEQLELGLRTLILDLKNINLELVVAERRKDLMMKVKELPKESINVIRDNLITVTKKLKELKIKHEKMSKAKTLLDQIKDLPQDSYDEIKHSLITVQKVLYDKKLVLEKTLKSLTLNKAQLKELNTLKKDLLETTEQWLKTKRALRKERLWQLVGTGFNELLKLKEQEYLKRLTKAIPTYTKSMFGKQGKWLKAELCKTKRGIDLQLLSSGIPIPKEGLSPGQRAKLGLASIFGLRDLFNTECDLLILDEPLSSVDEEGADGFASIIMELKKYIGTIIVISHISELKGLAFDRVWTAVINNGLSTLEIG